MARNRKYRTTAARFGPAIKAFLLCLLISGSGIGYVWQKTQIVELGKQIKQRETRLGGLEKQNEKLKGQLADMRRVAYIEDRIKRQGLGLAQPLPGQIWRLTEPPSDRRETGTPEVDAQVALQETKGLP
jgi:cell division protein FtsB